MLWAFQVVAEQSTTIHNWQKCVRNSLTMKVLILKCRYFYNTKQAFDHIQLIFKYLDHFCVTSPYLQIMPS